MNRVSVHKFVFVALLIVAAIIITSPLLSAIRVVHPPAAFTFAIHVPIFIAMFISPAAALAVAVGTAFGVWIDGGHAVIMYRVSSHILFALLGAWYLQIKPQILSSFFKSQIFSFVIGIIHAWVEVTVVSFFYLNGDTADSYYSTTKSILLFVGLGTLLHSMLDFVIAFTVFKLLTTQKILQPIFVTSHTSVSTY